MKRAVNRSSSEWG